KRLSIFGLISAAALVSGVLVGCGGSSASTAGQTGTVATTGGVTTSTGTSQTNAPSNPTTPQQVQVTTASGTVPGTVPPGQPDITTTSTVGVVPMTTPFIGNTQFAAFKALTTATSHPLNISYDNGATWAWTGINVNSDTSLDKNLVLAGGTHCWLQAVGPFAIIGGTAFAPTQLTIGQFIYGVIVNADGTVGIPSGINAKLPANNGTTAAGNHVNVSFPTPDFATGSGQLKITWPGITKTQTKVLNNGAATFNDPLQDSSDNVPSTGVTTVQFLLSQ
ncbi:MAG: hypothetical protein P4L46_24325, partial [Fimbriimonas sp.]|nr:hypothetical protein [Fimbriimonas sp.]